jgi:hypothetical protein
MRAPAAITDLQRGVETGDAPANVDVAPKNQSDRLEGCGSAPFGEQRCSGDDERADDDGAEKPKMIDKMRKKARISSRQNPQTVRTIGSSPAVAYQPL